MAINPISGSSPLDLPLNPSSAQAQAGTASGPTTNASDPLLTDLANTNSSTTDPLLAELSGQPADLSNDPLLSDLSSQTAGQETAALFAALTGDTSAAATDPAQQDQAFFDQQLNVPVPAQQAVNAYLNSQSMTNSPAQPTS